MFFLSSFLFCSCCHEAQIFKYDEKQKALKKYNKLNLVYLLARVESVSVGLRSKERQRNGIFGALPARKLAKKRKEGRGGGEGGKRSPFPLPSFLFLAQHHFLRGQNTENPGPLSLLASQHACYAGYVFIYKIYSYSYLYCVVTFSKCE